MYLGNHLLKLWDEFYAEVSEHERKKNQATNLIFRKMRKYLDEETDGFSDDQDQMLIVEVKNELDELMEYLSDDEKKRNPRVSKLSSEIQEHLDALRDLGDDDNDDESEEDDDDDQDKLMEDEEWNFFEDQDESDAWDWSDRGTADDSENEEDEEW